MSSRWYLLAYDIRCPKRLQRVQRMVAGEGYGLQQSVYLVRSSRWQLRRLLKRLESELDSNEDDVRAYPVTHPAQLWCGGAMVAVTPSATPRSDDEMDSAPAPEPFYAWLGQAVAWIRGRL
jgi:CRISPR-associated endonuclease Cas2